MLMCILSCSHVDLQAPWQCGKGPEEARREAQMRLIMEANQRLEEKKAPPPKGSIQEWLQGVGGAMGA